MRRQRLWLSEFRFSGKGWLPENDWDNDLARRARRTTGRPGGRYGENMPGRLLKLGVVAALLPLLGACVSAPPRPRPDLRDSAQAFEARRLEQLLPQAPPPAEGWNRAQWLEAALILNPDLADARARAAAVAAARRTAAQRPNPTLNLFDEYVTAAAGGVGWLYGLSLDFLLQRPGERARNMRTAALQAQAAQSDVAESIWQLRAALRQSLLDAVHAEDEAALLRQLLADRERLLASVTARARSGEIGAVAITAATYERSAVQQRLGQAIARGIDARSRFAAAVGVPVAALEGLPLQWPHWSEIDTLTPTVARSWHDEALIARPDLVRTLLEYDQAENALQSEVAHRWPEFHVVPGYAWDKGGVRENQLNETLHDNELGVNLELPLFHRNEGPIGEAIARREAAGKHIEAVQAQLFEQMDRAEQAWPHALEAWQQAGAAAALAVHQSELEQRALEAGASDRSSAVLAAVEAIEAQLLTLQAAYDAQQAFGALESAYRRPLDGPEREMSLNWRTE
jgi:outer membrane protein, heavy metal efflux system